MDLSSHNKYMEASTLFSSHVGASILESNNVMSKASTKNPFLLDPYADPLCKLNLKETSDFVKSLSVGGNNNATENRGILEFSTQRVRDNSSVGSVTKRLVDAPQTPGRPVFSFSHGSFSRKSFPSKWDDAEKWLVSGSSGHDSPGNNGFVENGLLMKSSFESSKMYTRQCSGYKPHLFGSGDDVTFAEKTRDLNEGKIANFQGTLMLDHHHLKNSSARTIDELSLSTSAGLLLKDKFPNEPLQESFLFGNHSKLPDNSPKLEILKHRDIGTEMTPLGSSTTSRCPTPFKSPSPARHNTPENRSGPLAPTSTDSSSNTVELQECHLAKLSLGTQFDSVATNWSSREEEEEDVSKSLRHFEMSAEFRKSVSESSRAASCLWDEDKAKSCLRYQREQAKIQAWVNLQSAKAEAESRKLEVKIQKMRSNLEEKLMKRMADVRRKAEEWRAEAQFQHSDQVRKIGQRSSQSKAMIRNKFQFSGHKSCGCFPSRVINK